jgi:hypothetical protein
VRVGIIDTGIAVKEIRDDGWLDEVVRTDTNIDELDVLPELSDGFLDLAAGHGTFVAGIVKQVAPKAEVKVYRALDTDGVGSEVDVANALLTAADDECQIINLSLGCETTDDIPPVAIDAALNAIRAERGDQVVIVAAAGNFGDTTRVWPAAFPKVVSVAGLDRNLDPTDWSSRGGWITCSTVGEGLLSAYVQGEETHDQNPAPDAFPFNAWGIWSGTSFTAPQITGAVARAYQESSESSVADACEILLATGFDVTDFGKALKILDGA